MFVSRDAADVRAFFTEMRSLGKKNMSTYLRAQSRVDTPSGAGFMRASFTEASRDEFYGDLDRLVELRGRLENFPSEEFGEWWKTNRDFYVNNGLVSEMAENPSTRLVDMMDRLSADFVVNRGIVKGPTWASKMVRRLHPKAILWFTVVTVPVAIGKKVIDIFLFGSGTRVTNAAFNPVIAPIEQKAGQVGAQYFAKISAIETEWLTASPDFKAAQHDMKQAVDELNRFSFEGMSQEEAAKAWADWQARLYPLSLRSQQVLPGSIRDARGFFRDLVISAPIALGTSFASYSVLYDQQLGLLRGFEARVKAGEKLNAADREEMQRHKDEVDAAVAGITTTLSAWELIKFLYPEVARDPTNAEQARTFMDGYNRFTKMMRFDLFAKNFGAGVGKYLEQVDLVIHNMDYTIQQLQQNQPAVQSGQ